MLYTKRNLTTTPSRIIASWLVAQPGLEGIVFADHQPDQPTACLTIYGTTGQPRGREHRTGSTSRLYGFQVRARGVNPKEGTALMATAVAALEGLYKGIVVVDGVSYQLQAAHLYGTVTTLAAPGKERQPEYVQDYRITILEGV